MLCASVGRRDGSLGILKLSSRAPGAFGEHELAIVQRFTSLASVALKRAQTIEDLQARMLKIERQNALEVLHAGPLVQVMNLVVFHDDFPVRYCQKRSMRIIHGSSVTTPAVMIALSALVSAASRASCVMKTTGTASPGARLRCSMLSIDTA